MKRMLGDALRLIRVYHGKKQMEAARELGVSRSYLSELEKGSKEPSLEVLRKYEYLYKIPVSSILFFSEKIENPSAKEKARVFAADKVLSLLRMVEARAELEHEDA